MGIAFYRFEEIDISYGYSENVDATTHTTDEKHHFYCVQYAVDVV